MLLPYVDAADLSRYVDTEVEAGGYWTFVNAIAIRVVHWCPYCGLSNNATLQTGNVSTKGEMAAYCVGRHCRWTGMVTLNDWMGQQRRKQCYI